MIALDHGIPAKVLAKARQLGIHNDCLVAGVAGCCKQCSDNLTVAFDFFYGDLDKDQTLGTIIADLLEEEYPDD